MSIFVVEGFYIKYSSMVQQIKEQTIYEKSDFNAKFNI